MNVVPASKAASKKSLQISIRTRVCGEDAHEKFITKHIRTAHAMLRSPLQEFSIVLVGDKTMIRLHKQFMQMDSTTDVLTFPLEHDAYEKVIVGEVVVCVSEARRRAKENKISLRNELLLYTLHGLLHLSGFDDRTARQFAKMHRMEDHILRTLGVGAVFDSERK